MCSDFNFVKCAIVLSLVVVLAFFYAAANAFINITHYKNLRSFEFFVNGGRQNIADLYCYPKSSIAAVDFRQPISSVVNYYIPEIFIYSN